MKVKETIEPEEIKRIEEAELLRDEPGGFLFDPVEHVYTLNGKRMYGITNVLKVINKPSLIQWGANTAVDVVEKALADMPNFDARLIAWPVVLAEARVAHRKKKEEAGALGTDVHAEIEAYINYCMELGGQAQPLKEGLETEVSAQTKLFVGWAIEKNAKFLASEIRLYSETMWVAGTADFVAEIGGKLFIGDIKTSSAIYPENYIQASAYAHMAVEMGLFKQFDGVIIVNVPKRGGLNVKENYALEGNFEAFRACLTLFKFLEAQVIKK
jgi:hypothetical protein